MPPLLMADRPDYYTLLGVLPEATTAEIMRAYHARTHAQPNADKNSAANLLTAVSVLTDGQLRRAYDLTRVGRGQRKTLSQRVAIKSAAPSTPAPAIPTTVPVNSPPKDLEAKKPRTLSGWQTLLVLLAFAGVIGLVIWYFPILFPNALAWLEKNPQAIQGAYRLIRSL